MHRIIAEKDPQGHWSAWFAGNPCCAFGGEHPADAVKRLLHEYGHDPAMIEADYTANREGHMEFTIGAKVCPECGGSGKYVGLNAVDVCRACGGASID